ncbi:MAG: polysaccharide biosynthesis tyrosine autokinase [Cyanobacteria bacterium P01_A01_bin.84]
MSNYNSNTNSSNVLPAQIITAGWEAKEDDWNFRDFLSLTRRRSLTIVGVTTALMTGVVVGTLKQTPKYEGNFRLLVEPVNNDENLPDLTPDKDRESQQSSLDYESQVQVLTSPELIDDAVKELKTSYPDISYDSLTNALTIERVGKTKIIEVHYRSNNPQRVKNVLDKLAKTYLDYSLEKRQTKLYHGIKFVDQQLPPIQKKVTQLEQQLQIFRQKHNFIDPETQSQQIEEQVRNVNERRLQINQQLAKSRSLLTSLRGNKGSIAALADASVHDDLLKRFSETEIELAKESTRFREDSPPIQAIKEKRQNILPLLQKEAQRILDIKKTAAVNEVQELEQQSKIIEEAENFLQGKIKQLPLLVRRYNELQRSIKIANESLNRFLAARETIQIKIAQTDVPWRLVQAPVKPLVPSSPDVQRQIILGIIASTLLGIGSGLLLEKLDNSYHSVDRIKEKSKLPILATIPYERQLRQSHKGHLSPVKASKSSTLVLETNTDGEEIYVEQPYTVFDEFPENESKKFLEALRILNTNIQLLSSDEPIRSIAISSANVGDGKSTIAFYLARAAANMGKRVLLVDADMRSPKIHKLAGLDNSWGLSNVISSSSIVKNLEVENTIQEIVRELPSVGKLSIMTAGQIPPDPTKLLSSRKMEQLIANFHQAFDLVVYDVPTAVGLADAHLIGSSTDGVVLVTKIHKTDRSSLNQAMDSLKTSNIPILGIVANGVKGGKFLTPQS